MEMSAGIGAMNRALDWPTGVDATPRAGEEILSLLRRPATVHAALWPTGAPAELGQLLDAVLAARPEIRCSAAQAPDAPSPEPAKPKDPSATSVPTPLLPRRVCPGPGACCPTCLSP